MKRLFISCLLVALALAPATVRAHNLSFLQGDVVVHPDKVEVRMDVLPSDILLSSGMVMIVLDKIDKADIEKGVAAYQSFLLNGLVILDASGHRLKGRISKIDSIEVPAEGIALDTLMATSFVYRVEYPLASCPAQLGFLHQFNSESNPVPVSMQLTVTRAGQSEGVTIPIPTGETPETIAFQWAEAAPPATVVVPAHTASLDPGDVFLYIQNDEVRLELMIPLATIETWIPVSRKSPDFLEVSEQAALQDALGTFFTEHNPVLLDTVTVKPTLSRLEFFGTDFKDFSQRPEPKRLSAASARAGAILSYSTKGAPRHVEWTWSLFNDRATAVRGTMFAFDKGMRFALAPASPMVTWDNPGVPPLPKIEAVLTRQGAGDDKARAALAERLLRNVYRGFDYHSESDVYDALAQSVQGDLLTDLYLKIKQGLTAQDQGGAVARVQEVKVVRAEAAPGEVQDGFSERVTWQVTGTVEHWGHIHTRINEYTADLGIAKTAGAWKLSSLAVAAQSQIKSAMSVRTL